MTSPETYSTFVPWLHFYLSLFHPTFKTWPMAFPKHNHSTLTPTPPQYCCESVRPRKIHQVWYCLWRVVGGAGFEEVAIAVLFCKRKKRWNMFDIVCEAYSGRGPVLRGWWWSSRVGGSTVKPVMHDQVIKRSWLGSRPFSTNVPEIHVCIYGNIVNFKILPQNKDKCKVVSPLRILTLAIKAVIRLSRKWCGGAMNACCQKEVWCSGEEAGAVAYNTSIRWEIPDSPWPEITLLRKAGDTDMSFGQLKDFYKGKPWT